MLPFTANIDAAGVTGTVLAQSPMRPKSRSRTATVSSVGGGLVVVVAGEAADALDLLGGAEP